MFIKLFSTFLSLQIATSNDMKLQRMNMMKHSFK